MQYKPATFVNNSSRLLVPIIFSKENAHLLFNLGLKGVYLDDYGYRSKFNDCLFFLFNTTGKFYTEFEKKIIDFESFYDWYDVDSTHRMYVFRVSPVYKKDLLSFRNNKLNELSEEFYKITPEETYLNGINVDLSKEIYRFEAINKNR